jgi:hypothetical protein
VNEADDEGANDVVEAEAAEMVIEPIERGWRRIVRMEFWINTSSGEPICRAEFNQNLTRVGFLSESTLANDSSFRDHCKQTSS